MSKTDPSYAEELTGSYPPGTKLQFAVITKGILFGCKQSYLLKNWGDGRQLLAPS